MSKLRIAVVLFVGLTGCADDRHNIAAFDLGVGVSPGTGKDVVQPPNRCLPPGQACSPGNFDCCSKSCTGGICQCAIGSQACSASSDCCSGVCNAGICASPGCHQDGMGCSNPGD